MKTRRNMLAHLACIFAIALAYAPPVQAQEMDNDKACLECHAKLVQKKVVHAAVHMSCASCHSELDASVTPHKSRGKIAGGLTAEGSALCTTCHDKKMFEGKVVHGAVAEGTCLGCHDPHVSDYLGLLKMEPAALCLDCHPEVKNEPHIIAGFSRSGHPLGNDKNEAQDPLRPGKKFYCAACHEPHRSERPKLNRFDKGMASCLKCHQM